MNVLELFAGSRSFSRASEKYGAKTYTTDFIDFDKIDQVCDVFDFDPNKVPFVPDVIWTSPPCTFFSVASIGRHWNKDHTPKTENAKLGVKIIERTKDIIKHFQELNPHLIWFMENPRGKLRKLDCVDNYYINTVTYCSYGDSRMKPTDIWTNLVWLPKTLCFNGNRDCHHEPAPRGSSTGTQGLKSTYLKSQLPEELCDELYRLCLKGETK